jgi:hypothetical protein
VSPDEVLAVDLKLPIVIHSELSDSIIKATGLLDLASGEIGRVEYEDYDERAEGLPMERDDYEFTSGLLTHAGKDVEFSIHVDRTTGRHSVSADELLEIKVRAAKLFAGIEGVSLLAGSAGQPAPAPAPAAVRPPGAGRKPRGPRNA